MIAAILKAIGIKLSPEDLANLEKFIPQIPAQAQRFVFAFNAAVRQNRDALERVEEKLDAMDGTLERIVQKIDPDAVPQTLATMVHVMHNGNVEVSANGDHN